ncbi:acyltransferase [Streptococcus dentapri]|uniref:Acyltransferase n=1 Tax=Streptococcus dentapri TaxID=573564 RepID=A0ABV8D255_9STRE
MKEKSERNLGIDLLRIFAMLMIIITHILGKGGIRDEVQDSVDVYYWVTWLIQVTAYGAVNCYALISGYVGIHSHYKYSKALSLWLQVIFYTLGFALIFSLEGQTLTQKDWLKAFFPVITGQYWYITAYFGLLIFMPLLNIGLSKISNHDLKYLVIVAIFFFSVMPAMFDTRVDEFSFAKGFSMNWLTVLYIIGAYLKRLDLERLFKERTLLLIFAGSIAVTFIMKFIKGDIWYWYTSPSMLAGSIAIFIRFETLRIKRGGIGAKLITLFSSTTLGVYLVHLNPLLVRFWLRDVFIPFVDFPIYFFPFLILGTALLIFLISALIEILRNYLFRKLRILNFVAKIDTKFPFGRYN